MRKHFRLSVIASAVVGCSALSLGVVSLPAYSDLPPDVRIYQLEKKTSLYQLALASQSDVAELRRLNKGSLDQRESLNAGESLLLPASSSLFPRNPFQTGATDAEKARWDSLPELGMGNEAVAADTTERKTAGVAQKVGSQNWNEMSGDQVKGQAETWVKGEVSSRVLTPLEQQAQDLLGKFGKAQVSLSVDDRGDLSKSTASLFTPWFENDDHVLFSQAGVHDQDGRTIGNIGLGHRWDQQSWLLGYNVFYDHDFSRNHSRLGLGAEVWADNLKLAANYYHPLSGWKDSKDFEDYLERPAEGFDLRVQGYLPAYPHLGASAVYEQYYGDEVALFGKDNLQKDPHAVTMGLDYTPFPLATLKVSHKQGQDSKKEAQVDLTLNYQLGTSLSSQLDPDNVAAMRSLRGSRYDLVDRNYDIVLEYKDNALLSIDLAAVPTTLLEGDTYLMQPLVKSKYKIVAISWDGDVIPLSLLATAGTTNTQGWQITLPAWDATPNGKNIYQLAIRVEDEKGRQLTSNMVDILVGQQRLPTVTVVDDKHDADADGSDEIHLNAWIKDHQGKALIETDTLETWQVLDAQGNDLLATGVVKLTRSLDAATGERKLVMTADRAVTALVSGNFGPYGSSGVTTLRFNQHEKQLEAQIYIGTGEDAPLLVGAPQVDTEYSVKIWDTRSGTPVNVTEQYRDTIKWHMVEETVGNNDAIVAVGTDVLKTQATNTQALHTHSQHLSEQGLRLYVEYDD